MKLFVVYVICIALTLCTLSCCSVFGYYYAISSTIRVILFLIPVLTILCTNNLFFLLSIVVVVFLSLRPFSLVSTTIQICVSIYLCFFQIVLRFICDDIFAEKEKCSERSTRTRIHARTICYMYIRR